MLAIVCHTHSKRSFRRTCPMSLLNGQWIMWPTLLDVSYVIRDGPSKGFQILLTGTCVMWIAYFENKTHIGKCPQGFHIGNRSRTVKSSGRFRTKEAIVGYVYSRLLWNQISRKMNDTVTGFTTTFYVLSYRNALFIYGQDFDVLCQLPRISSIWFEHDQYY